MAGIEPYIHRRVVVLRADTHATEAARAMCEQRIGCVLVANAEGGVAGIITDRDIMCGLIAGGGEESSLGALLTGELIAVSEYEGLEEAIAKMETFGIRRVPILHEAKDPKKRKCVGLVTLDDLIVRQEIDGVRLARILKAQVLTRKAHIHSTERSVARAEHTLAKFYKTICESAGIERERVADLVQVALTGLVRRLHYTTAAHFIAQLPSLLQEELLDLDAGPDRSVTMGSMVARASTELNLSEDFTVSALERVFVALAEVIDPHELERVRSQLPAEMQGLLTARHKTAA